MGPAIGGGEGEEEGVASEFFLEGGEDRDGAAFAHEGRFFPEDFFQGAAGGETVGAVRIEEIGGPAVSVFDFQPDSGGSVAGKVFFGHPQDVPGFLIGDEAEGNLEESLRRQHRLAALALVASADPVDLGGGTRPDPFDRAESCLAVEFRDTRLFGDVGIPERRGRCGFPFPGGGSLDGVVESGNGHPSAFIVETGDQTGGCGCRVGDRSSVDAGMEIVRGAQDPDLHGGNSTEGVAEGRISVGGHSGVGDGDHIAGEFSAVFFQKVREVAAADLLFSFDQENDIDRERSFLESFGDAEDMGQDLSFVVGRSPGKDPPIADFRFKWGRTPLRKGLRRLHIVVAVDQDRSLGGIAPGFSNHNRMPRRFFLAGLQSDAPELRHQPIRTSLQIVFVGGLGGNAWKAEKFQEFLNVRIVHKKRYILWWTKIFSLYIVFSLASPRQKFTI